MRRFSGLVDAEAVNHRDTLRHTVGTIEVSPTWEWYVPITKKVLICLSHFASCKYLRNNNFTCSFMFMSRKTSKNVLFILSRNHANLDLSAKYGNFLSTANGIRCPSRLHYYLDFYCRGYKFQDVEVYSIRVKRKEEGWFRDWC